MSPQTNTSGFQWPGAAAPELGSGLYGMNWGQSAQPGITFPSSTDTPAADPGLLAGLGDWLKNSGFLASTDSKGVKTDGFGGLALNVGQSLAGAYMGMKQYGLAKESLAQSKQQFNLNYDAQKKLTNSQLEDRQRARVASNPSAYQSVGSYMNQNGVN